MAPDGWKTTSLGQLAEVNPEQLNAVSPDFELEYLDISGIPKTGTVGKMRLMSLSRAPSRARRRARSGDILVSTVRPYLRAFARLSSAPDNLVVSTGFAVLRARNEADSEFIYQVVLSEDFVRFLVPRMRGGNYPAVIPEDIANFHLLVPPQSERERITEILTAVDKNIEATQATIEQLQVVKQAMLAELLSRGIPRLCDRSTMVETGEVAAGWEAAPLSSLVAEGPTNGLYKPAGMIGRGSLVAGMTAIDGSSLDWSKCRRAELTKQESTTFGLKKDDILVTRVYARVGGVGRFILVGSPPEVAVYESNMMRIRVRPDVVSPGFLVAYMSSTDVRRALVQRATLGAQASINRRGLNSMVIRLPPLAEQEEILDVVGAVEDRIRKEREFYEDLVHLKSALLPALLTGEIRVPLDQAQPPP
jgi:type I restriction enzyme S subunit